jgi:outer membrane receptor for ferrienterochelin and colicin
MVYESRKVGIQVYYILVLYLFMPNVTMAHSGDEVFDFFAEEARVTTASRQPTTLQEAPATMHVVTAQDIQDSGAQTIWDALRTVPGVDVMIVQTFQGEVGIRGMNKALNNRVLVLLDGKPILSGYFERVNWEYLPVGLAEIDRIEVVLGPVSALYGPNAISGVINVITKTPQQISHGVVHVMAGDYHTLLGNAVVGMQSESLSGKMSVGWRSTRLLEDANDPASRVNQWHGFLQKDMRENAYLAVRGGLVHIDSRNNVGGLGSSFERGPSGYLRADYQQDQTRLQGFWNRNGTQLFNDDDDVPLQFDLDSDCLEFDVEQDVTLSKHQALTVGGSVKHNRMRSGALSLGVHKRTLWSLFFEDHWHLHPQLSFVLSGRLDHHSVVGLQGSPRGSVIWEPQGGHVFRISAGTSFRFPTITESALQFDQQLALSSDSNLPFHTVALSILGNLDLKAEQMRMLEGAYTAKKKNLQFMGTMYVYRLKHVIATTLPEIGLTMSVPTVRVSFGNRPGQIRAWGGEMGLKVGLGMGLDGTVNYAYQNIKNDIDPLSSVDGSPTHKVNMGLRFQKRGWTISGWMHWVGATLWYQNDLVPDVNAVGRVDAYALINAQARYAFSGALKKWVMGISAFNLLNNKHFETLPASALGQGQRGEIVQRRIVGTLTFAF